MMNATPPGPSRHGVGEMFDRIAPRYDLLNRMLSMGLDLRWRQRVLDALPEGDELRCLDVATGTGDLAIALARHPRVAEVVGIDISEEMLAVGREKVGRLDLDEQVRLESGDALALSAYRGFDVATIAFGIRNVLDVTTALRQMKESLRPGGRVLVLEFSEPEGALFGPVYRAYRKLVLPRLGGLISGDTEAYRYLDETIATFPSGDAFLERMRDAGLVDVQCAPLTLGSVSLYLGTRPESEGANA